tara:strand:- start:143 stop:571 length:429 start_codon:yes stop_codon:yes gene_type:complete
MNAAPSKPANWKELRTNLKLATSPLRLDRLKEAIDAPGCHPDTWVLEPDPTPLMFIIRYAGTYGNIDDDEATAAAKMLIDAGANLLHTVTLHSGKVNVLQTADKWLKGKEQNYPKLFELLRAADENAKNATNVDAGRLEQSS